MVSLGKIIQMTKEMIKAIIINPRDNVAIATKKISSGQKVRIEISGKVKEIIAKQDIPQGHKIALTRISKGEAIIKYGEVIGYAKRDILEGEHVHIHNVVGRDEII